MGMGATAGMAVGATFGGGETTPTNGSNLARLSAGLGNSIGNGSVLVSDSAAGAGKRFVANPLLSPAVR